MSTRTVDPLRRARRAVLARNFKDALDELARLRASSSGNAEWLLLSAMVAWRLGRFSESLEFARGALAGYRTRGDTDGEMRSENVAAAGHFALGNLDEAEAGFSQALTLARHLRDVLMMARSANNMGNVEYYRGRNIEGLMLYTQAATLFEQVGSLHGIAEAYHNQGVVLREVGDLEAARAATDRALEAAQLLGDSRALGWALGARGETDALRGDIRLGRAQVERALELARTTGDRLTEIDSLRVLTGIARRAGEHEAALENARAATELARHAGSRWAKAQSALELGEVLGAIGREAESREAFREAAELFTTMGAATRAEAAAARAGDPA
jgi:tetratricopeptide (TPR) repeat protein